MICPRTQHRPRHSARIIQRHARIKSPGRRIVLRYCD
jgi:hypothetical protein